MSEDRTPHVHLRLKDERAIANVLVREWAERAHRAQEAVSKILAEHRKSEDDPA